MIGKEFPSQTEFVFFPLDHQTVKVHENYCTTCRFNVFNIHTPNNVQNVNFVHIMDLIDTSNKIFQTSNTICSFFQTGCRHMRSTWSKWLISSDNSSPFHKKLCNWEFSQDQISTMKKKEMGDRSRFVYVNQLFKWSCNSVSCFMVM